MDCPPDKGAAEGINSLQFGLGLFALATPEAKPSRSQMGTPQSGRILSEMSGSDPAPLKPLA